MTENFLMLLVNNWATDLMRLHSIMMPHSLSLLRQLISKIAFLMKKRFVSAATQGWTAETTRHDETHERFVSPLWLNKNDEFRIIPSNSNFEAALGLISLKKKIVKKFSFSVNY